MQILFMIIMFFIAVLLKNNSIIDICWSLNFVLGTYISFLITLLINRQINLIQITLTFLISIWGFRLAYHIGRRNIGKGEDKRYAERFEHYVNCSELGNHYSELNNPAILEENWKKQESALKKGDEVVGSRVRALVRKNKVAPPFRKAEFDILFNRGIDRMGETIDFGEKQGVVKKSGSWYEYAGKKLGQGKEAAREFLWEHPKIAREIEEKIEKTLTTTQETKKK